MIKGFFVKEYIKFQKKTVVGKILNVFGKVLFGKMAWVTGYDPNGKEFFKTATTRSIDNMIRRFTETGYSELEEHTLFETVEPTLKQLKSKRVRNI